MRYKLDNVAANFIQDKVEGYEYIRNVPAMKDIINKLKAINSEDPDYSAKNKVNKVKKVK